MEWIDGIRCTDVAGIISSGVDVDNFIKWVAAPRGRGEGRAVGVEQAAAAGGRVRPGRPAAGSPSLPCLNPPAPLQRPAHPSNTPPHTHTRHRRVGVVSGLRQLLEFGLFHGDPHPGNIFCLRDGRIAYVDFGNVAQLSNAHKQVLVDAVVHAVNEDYQEMAGDFIKLGFLAPGTDINPIVPALEKIWRDSRGQSLADFNFRWGRLGAGGWG